MTLPVAQQQLYIPPPNWALVGSCNYASETLFGIKRFLIVDNVLMILISYTIIRLNCAFMLICYYFLA